jgi:hypothetical protein
VDCTMNTGSRKLLHKARSTFCGRQEVTSLTPITDQFCDARHTPGMAMASSVLYSLSGALKPLRGKCGRGSSLFHLRRYPMKIKQEALD